jgi:hypothetical protein
MYRGETYHSVSNLLSLALFSGCYLSDPTGTDSLYEDSKRGMTSRSGFAACPVPA